MICKYVEGESAIEHNVNNAYISTQMDSNRPDIGLSNFKLVRDDTSITCHFTRQNTHFNENYFNVYGGYYFYMIGAFGPISKLRFVKF